MLVSEHSISIFGQIKHSFINRDFKVRWLKTLLRHDFSFELKWASSSLLYCEERERERDEMRGGGMWCKSCREEYCEEDAGTCKECYEEASETEEELKREIEDLKSKVAFLRLTSPLDSSSPTTAAAGSHDILLHANPSSSTPPVPAHRAVLISRSPVFRAMLENEMEESRSGTIKITDVSYDVLRSFVHYLYTAEALLDEQLACDLLVLAEKYQVKHLKQHCENFLTSKVNDDNALSSFAFAHRHGAKRLLEAAMSLLMDIMGSLSEREEYKELVEKDPRLVVELYEAYLTKQVNTAVKRKGLVQCGGDHNKF